VKEGTVSDDMIAVMDVFATVAEITGDGLPEEENVAPDSYSFYPALMGEKNREERKSLITADMYGMQAIRMGHWKYITDQLPPELPERRRRNIKMPLELQLYNLEEDPAESENLFEKHPDIVDALTAELERIRNLESNED
jgi:arylsulfatase A-like enzyme